VPLTFPRVLSVDLRRLAHGAVARAEPWRRPAQGARGDCARWGGAGLAVALLRERAGRGRAAPFCIAVGDAVRRGLPTAARATVAGRSPLFGGLAEGQVGGSLGRRLARTADAVRIEGVVDGRDGVLVVDPDGSARLEHLPELRGLDPDATHARLVARFAPRFGALATLRVGPAAEHGVKTASLASGDAHASFTGRGGLGAAFAAHGLKALVVAGEEVEPSATGHALVRALARSPRLRARAEDGTFELAPARAARGEIAAADADALYRGARAAARERIGCAGCPTPCGWAFGRPGGPGETPRGVPARFGKVWSLGAPLGLARFEDALELAAACDRVGVDAKETGAALAVLARARGARGDRARLLAWIADLGLGSGEGLVLGEGAAGAARALGVAPEPEQRAAEGADRGLAARLGTFVAGNGADPMRTFPFLLEAGPGRLRALTGLALAPGAEDPLDPAGKGSIVWWHERFVAALDAAGFCAFSAAGLLADGELDLEAFAGVLGAADGAELIALGDAIVAVRRELAARWGRAPGAVPDELAAMYAEYLACGASARPTGAFRSSPAAQAEPAAAAAELGSARGDVRLRLSGPLARKLGDEVSVELERPQPWGDVLATAVSRDPRRAGALAANAYRAGRRLAPEDVVRPGDVVDLVVAIAGG
jgi:aldehyde:ferredoxin oxidoreductase